ncbi:MAG: NnrS family protein [Gammaproteobacteria bacterium]|nr:NnrS family protein [Gammaproteobacteria bacterium]
MPNWNTFTAAPHRMMMFAGSLQLVLTMSFWLAELLARYLNILPGITPVIPATWAHGYLMLFGLFPYFIFGFLMTTYPRWMNGPLVERSRYVASFLCMTTGSVTVYAGLFTHTTVLATGALLHAFGWFIGISELYRVFRAAPGPEKSHERYLNLYLLLGGIGMLSFVLGTGLDRPGLIQTALTLGWWGFLLPLLVTVAHRMLPFFSSMVIKPYTVVQPAWMLPALPLLIAGHVACETLNIWQWRFLFDAPLAGIGLYLSFRWGFRRSFQVRLLAILHMAFVWFGIGMTLYTLDSLLLLFSTDVSLGRAPLHALGIGLVAGMTLAMASRVSLGHSGRPLVADRRVWLCCWGLHITALLRVVNDLPIGQTLFGLPTPLWAALLWLVTVFAWSWRFAPIYLRPRVDGNPG